jgi:hypothetical protein
MFRKLDRHALIKVVKERVDLGVVRLHLRYEYGGSILYSQMHDQLHPPPPPPLASAAKF